jgi:hypothetical protein
MYRADVLENAVWEEVRKLLSEPESVLRQYDEYIERQRRLMRGDPDMEERDFIERLQKLDQRRSGYVDLAADRVISHEELRAKLVEVDEQREAVQKALREARDRQEMLRKLQRNRKMWEAAFERFVLRRGLGLFFLGAEYRRQVFQALRLRVEVDKNGDVRISGVFDVDITEVLLRGSPTERRGAGRHSVVNYESSPPFRGNISVDNTRGSVPKIPEVTRVADTPYRSYCSGCWPQPTR